MSPSLGDLKSDSGRKNLNQYLESRSYIEGSVDSYVGLICHMICHLFKLI